MAEQPPGPFAPSQELDDLRVSLRELLQSRSGDADVRRAADGQAGYDPELWRLLAQQVGVVGLTIPEQLDGTGFGMREQAIVLEELGRHMTCAPYLASAVLATQALLLADNDVARSKFLPPIARGELLATVALDEGRGIAGQLAPTVKVDASDEPRLTGSREFVLDAGAAQLFIVPATTDEGRVGLFAIERCAPGLETVDLETVDRTRRQGRLVLSRTPAVRLSADATESLATLRDIAAAAIAAEQVGGADRALADAVTYAKQRMAFGAPIGSYQAIKHELANVLLAVESARTLAMQAAWAVDNDRAELRIAGPMAKAFCSETFLTAAAANIQVHGGIGFTWEHSAHLLWKRAKTMELLFGTPRELRRLVADRMAL